MTIREDVFVILQAKGLMDINKTDEALRSLGLTFRLTGRDLLRMGSTINQVATFFGSFAQNILAGSDIIADATADVGMAFEDIFEVTGIIDKIANSLEWLAEIIEKNPWIAYIIIVFAVLAVIIKLIAIVMGVIGFIYLFVGAILSANKSGVGLIQTLKALVAAINPWSNALEQARQKLVALKAEALGIPTYIKDIEGAEAGETKTAKKQKKGWKGLASTGAKVAAGIGGLMLAFLLFEPIMNLLSPLIEAACGALESFLDPFEGIVDAIAEWIEQNEQLAGSLILALILLPFLIKGFGFLSGIVGKIGGIFGKTSGPLGEFQGELDKASGAEKESADSSYKMILALAVLLPMVIALIYALGDFLKVAKETGFTALEIGAIIGVLVLNLGAIFGVLVVVLKILQTLNTVNWSVIESFVVLGGLAIALIAAFAGFLIVAAQTRFSVAEIVALIWTLSANVQTLLVIFAGLAFLLSQINTINTNTIYLFIALVGAAISLILAFAAFLQIASATRFEVSEISTIIDKLTIAMLAFIIILAIAVIAIAALAPAAAIAWPVVGLVLALGAAALMMGAGFFLAGLGVQAAVEGVLKLAQNIGALIATLPVVIALAIAIGVLTVSIISLGIASLGAFLGLMALAAGIFALTLALLALTIPLGIIKALGGEKAVIAAIQKIPMLEEGGLIKTGGLAVVHPDEAVVPAAEAAPLRGGAGKYQPKEPPLTVTVDVTGVKSIDDIIKRAVEASVTQVSEQMSRRGKRLEK